MSKQTISIDDVALFDLTPKFVHTKEPRSKEKHEIIQYQQEQHQPSVHKAIIKLLIQALQLKESLFEQLNKANAKTEDTENIFLSILQSLNEGEIPTYTALSSIQNGIPEQNAHQKCVLFLLMAIQAKEVIDGLNAAKSALDLISKLPKQYHHIRTLIYYFMIICDKSSQYIGTFLEELENCFESVSSRNGYLLCWNAYNTIDDDRLLEKSLHFAWLTFEEEILERDRTATVCVVEASLKYIYHCWRSFDNEPEWEKAEQFSEKIFKLLNRLENTWASLCSSFSEIRAYWILFRLRRLLQFEDKSLHPPRSQLWELLDSIARLRSSFALEVSLFKWEFDPEGLQPRISDVFFNDTETYTPFQFLRRGLYAANMNNPHSAVSTIVVAIRTLLENFQFEKSFLSILFERFQFELLNFQFPKGLFLQKLITSLGMITFQHNAASSERMLTNVVSLLEEFASACSLESSDLPLPLIIDSEDLHNLFVFIYSALVKLNEKKYSEKYSQLMAARKPSTVKVED